MPEPTTKPVAVRNLQRYLRRLSYEDHGIPPVPVDGIFGSRTQESLSAFQRAFFLPVTGIADRETWDALFAEYSRLRREKDAPRFPDLFPQVPPHYETSMGESSAFITLLQWMLGELKVAYDSLPEPLLSGVYDDATASSVRAFQAIHGLPQTGRVNRAVWNRIVEEYNQYGT